MALLNKIFRTKENKKLASKGKDASKIVANNSEDGAGVEKNKSVFHKAAGLTRILLGPHLTEKTTNMSGSRKYVFLVSNHANKVDIKQAVEGRYGVHVITTRVLNMPVKERRRGRQIGWRPGFKKALITLKEGESIEIQ